MGKNSNQTKMLLNSQSSARAAWIAAIAACIAVTISISTLVYTIHKDSSSNKEELILSANFRQMDYISNLNPIQFTKNSDLGLPGKVCVYAKVLISNRGYKDISLVKYDIYEINEDANICCTEFLDEGLYSIADEKIEMPIIIESNHAKAFYIRIGVTMDTYAYKLALSKYGIGSSNSFLFDEFDDYLKSNGIDIFGSKIKYFNDGSYTIIERSKDHNGKYLIVFETAKGNTIKDSISWYQYD